MTTKEHLLMIAMLTKQRQFTKVLIDLLMKKCGVAASELPAFEFSVAADSVLRSELFATTRDSYEQVAKALEIETGLANQE